jgi:K+-sensing histidine kinase KdpD
VVLIFEEKTENIKNEKLTNLNKYKDQLLNSVSHELQTPLNSIQ